MRAINGEIPYRLARIAHRCGRIRSRMAELTTAQIGKAGELLVQQQLLLHGIESAILTTDTGIDLVTFLNRPGFPGDQNL